jgi:hypothetical protein
MNCIQSAGYASSQGVAMDDSMGRLVYLPAGASGPDPEAFLEDVLTGCIREGGQGRNAPACPVRFSVTPEEYLQIEYGGCKTSTYCEFSYCARDFTLKIYADKSKHFVTVAPTAPSR